MKPRTKRKRVVLGKFKVNKNEFGGNGGFAWLEFPKKWQGKKVRLIAEVLET